MGQSSPIGEELCAQEGQLGNSGWGGSGASTQGWKLSSPQDGRVVLPCGPWTSIAAGRTVQIPSPVPDLQNQKLRGGPSDLAYQALRGIQIHENLQAGRKRLHLVRFLEGQPHQGTKGWSLHRSGEGPHLRP